MQVSPACCYVQTNSNYSNLANYPGNTKCVSMLLFGKAVDKDTVTITSSVDDFKVDKIARDYRKELDKLDRTRFALASDECRAYLDVAARLYQTKQSLSGSEREIGEEFWNEFDTRISGKCAERFNRIRLSELDKIIDDFPLHIMPSGFATAVADKLFQLKADDTITAIKNYYAIQADDGLKHFESTDDTRDNRRLDALIGLSQAYINTYNVQQLYQGIKGFGAGRWKITFDSTLKDAWLCWNMALDKTDPVTLQLAKAYFEDKKLESYPHFESLCNAAEKAQTKEERKAS